MARIFISHSSEDQAQAARLLNWLHEQGFASTFLDFDKHRGIAPGSDWERKLYQELSNADAVILILTRNWFDSKWCFVEFAQARALGKAIFPLVESPTGETFVSPDIQHLDLVKDREGGLERLRAELTRIAINTRGGFPWDATRPPFPGLLAFDEADAAIYFGRDDDIRRLMERLSARRAQGGEKLIALWGASGAGKSSLLRAGVVPRLKRDPHNWIVLPPFRPQTHPLDELAQAVATGLKDAANWRIWRAAFEAEDLIPRLSDLARDVRAAYGENEAHIFLAIDQGEELFSGADRKQAEQFFRVLNALLDASLPFLAVIALRPEYLGKLQEAPGLTARFEEFPLKPMPLDRVREIIEGPARVANTTVDDALVSAAVEDARTDDALPLLAFALRELYDRSASSGRLTVEAYRALGDASADLSPLENAVRMKADEVLGAAKPSAEDLQALKEAFIPAMVRVNADGEYVRRPANMAALPARALPVVEALAKARLLTIRKEQNMILVEVAHEALLRKWPLVRGWLDEEREFLIGRDQLEADLVDWEKAAPAQKDETLLTGLKLTRARGWLAANLLQLSDAERSFIQASIAHHDAEAGQRERTRRRIVQWSVVIAASLAVLTIFAFLEWYQSRVRENLANSRALAMEALQSGTDAARALQAAVQAGKLAQSDEANFALNWVLEIPQDRLILSQGPLLNAAYSRDGSRVIAVGGDYKGHIWDAQSGRLMATLTGHTNAVTWAAFSPDGKQVVTASWDKTARIWDAQTGNLLHTLSGHADRVLSAEFSPDGKTILTASQDDTACIWDAGSGNLLHTLSGHKGAVYTATFSRDGEHIVTAGQDDTARIWNAEDGSLLHILAGHSKPVVSAAFSPNGARIVTASADNTARIWDTESGNVLHILTGHSNFVASAVFSPDGSQVVTASWDRTARIWDAESGNQLHILAGHSNSVWSAEFSPNGTRIVTASADYTARIWDASNGNALATLSGDTNVIFSVAFSPDSKHILTASFDGAARVWDIDSNNVVATLSGHTGPVNVAVFSPDGKQIATASADKTARIWDAETGSQLHILSGHQGAVGSAAFSPDGKQIVTASEDDTARIWDAATGSPLHVLTGHAGPVYMAAFSPDGKFVVTASDDKTARIWDAATGSPLHILAGNGASVRTAVFSPDGKQIVTASADYMARIWDAGTGNLLHTLKGHRAGVNTAEYSPDGKLIVTASADYTACIWDAQNGNLLKTLYGNVSAFSDAEFSHDSKRIVTASPDNTGEVWDAQSGNRLAMLSGHTGLVYSATFSPDDLRIVTASADGTARIWDASNGQILATVYGQIGAVRSATFSPDGRQVVTAGDAGTAWIFIADFSDLLQKAEQEVPVYSHD